LLVLLVPLARGEQADDLLLQVVVLNAETASVDLGDSSELFVDRVLLSDGVNGNLAKDCRESDIDL
jgi:hypothetical protein